MSVYTSESMHGSVSVQECVHAEASTSAEYVSTCQCVQAFQVRMCDIRESLHVCGHVYSCVQCVSRRVCAA